MAIIFLFRLGVACLKAQHKNNRLQTPNDVYPAIFPSFLPPSFLLASDSPPRPLFSRHHTKGTGLALSPSPPKKNLEYVFIWKPCPSLVDAAS